MHYLIVVSKSLPNKQMNSNPIFIVQQKNSNIIVAIHTVDYFCHQSFFNITE
ncbi:hypothetical protein Hanom_Chr11g01012881 [Helianthus anomalus]